MRGEDAERDPEDSHDLIEPAPRRILLIDSDVFVLFAAAGLLDRAIACLGFDRDDARRLDALPSMLRKGKKFEDLTDVEREAALTWCYRIAPFRESPNPDTMQKLAGIANIEPGEATLFATCHDNPVAVLFTGDKRALQALAKRARTFCAKLSGRVACLEQVLVAMVTADGVGAVYAALAVRAQHHKVLIVCFSEVHRVDQAACLSFLRSYINKVGNDLPANWLRAVQ
jgi:hypothetical protein